jgi:hypothetical protein
MAKRIKIGDIAEFNTKFGFAYAQFYHRHWNYGVLIRILPGFFAVRPQAFTEIASGKEVYSTFFPLQAAVNRKLVDICGNVNVPAHAKEFPLFRDGTPEPGTGIIKDWWLWDGIKEWRIGALSDEQLDLPILGIPSLPVLIEEIEEGWTPRRAQEFILRARAKMNTDATSTSTQEEPELRHFLIFDRHEDAVLAAKKMRALGLETGITDLGDDWGVNVLQKEQTEDAVETMEKQLTVIAREFKGHYDGTQYKIDGP